MQLIENLCTCIKRIYICHDKEANYACGTKINHYHF